MNIKATNEMLMIPAETFSHILAAYNALNSIKGLSVNLEKSIDGKDETANQFLQNEIYLKVSDQSLNNSLEKIGRFINNQPLKRSPDSFQIPNESLTLSEPSDEIIEAAFGEYLTDILGRDAWYLMLAEGLDAVLEKYDTHIIERYEHEDSEIVANIIQDYAISVQSLTAKQRTSTLIEVKNAVSKLASIEEAMDYLTTELETKREFDPLHESDVIKLYTEKTIQIFEEKIKAKEITLNDVPKLISRYGLMSSYDFMRHIDELMQEHDAEKVRFGDDNIYYGMGLDYLKNEGFKFMPILNSKQWNWSVGGGLNKFAPSLDEAIDDALSMIIPESDWKRTVEKGEFEGSWNQYIRTEVTQRHSEVCMRDGGHYVGKILDIKKGIVYQQIGRTEMDVQLHALMKFDTKPEIGDVLDIKYKDGKVAVKESGKSIER